MINKNIKSAMVLSFMEIKLRFKTAALGVHWFYIQQLVWAFGAGLVWSIVFNIELERFLPFIIISFASWNMISAWVIDSSCVFLNASGFLKNTNIHPITYVLKTLIVNTVILMMAMIPLVILDFFIDEQYLAINFILFFLAVLFLSFVFLPISFCFSYIGVHIKDLTPAVQSIFQVLFIASPVIYPPDLLMSKGYAWALNINPFYHFLEIIRSPVLYNRFPETENILVSLAIGVSFWLLYLFFVRKRIKTVSLYV